MTTLGILFDLDLLRGLADSIAS